MPWALAGLGLVLFKLWLVHGEEIVASPSGTVDAWWYVDSASRGYWGDPERPTAFVRLPALPLWIAGVAWTGLPLRIAIELLQAAGALAVAASLVRAGLPRALAAVAAAVIVLHPGSFALNSVTLPDGFYAAVLHLAVAAMVLQLCTGKLRYAAATGAALAVLWHTRAEGPLLLGLLVLFACLDLLVDRRRGVEARASLRRVALATGVSASILAASVLGIRAINQRVFGVFASSEMSSPALTAATVALLRVEPPERAPRYVSVPREARRLAYEASPSFAELAPHFEGPRGRAWERATQRKTGVEGEIGAGWLPWALHDLSVVAGRHTSTRAARDFYRRIADELERACREGALSCRRVVSALVDPDVGKWLPYLPGSFVRVAGRFLDPGPLPWESDRDAGERSRALYDAMANRRPALMDEGPPPGPLGAARSLQALLARHYRTAMLLGTAAACAALGVLAARRRSLPGTTALYATLALLAAVVASRVALLALLDASSWPTTRPGYVFPIATLYGVAIVILVHLAAAALRARPGRG